VCVCVSVCECVCSVCAFGQLRSSVSGVYARACMHVCVCVGSARNFK
jgi:hypothetical protein